MRDEGFAEERTNSGVLMDRGSAIKTPKTAVKKASKPQKRDVEHGDRNLHLRKAKEKGDWIRSGKIFPVKKVSSVISGVFSHKKTPSDGDFDLRDDSKKMSSPKADQKLAIVNVKADKKLSKTAESFRQIRRVSSSILLLGRRLKIRRSFSEKLREHTRGQVHGEDRRREDELCKKRILMGGKCKPLNMSGRLLYDKQGVLLPDP